MLHTLFAVVGLSARLAASAPLFAAVKDAGAAHLIWLGIKAIRERAPEIQRAEAGRISATAAFRQGFTTEALNPKTALFFLAFLPQFLRPENGAAFAQLLLLGTPFALFGFPSTLAHAVAAGQLGRLLKRHPAVVAWQGKVVGGIYCALGLRLALQER